MAQCRAAWDTAEAGNRKSYLEGELGRAPRGNGTERAPEVDGGG